MRQYEVIVQNIGVVCRTLHEDTAFKVFTKYKGQSSSGIGRAAFKSVDLLENGAVVEQHIGTTEAYRKAADAALSAWQGGACNIRAIARALVPVADAVCELLNSNTVEALRSPTGAPLRLLLNQASHLCGEFHPADSQFCKRVPKPDNEE